MTGNPFLYSCLLANLCFFAPCLPAQDDPSPAPPHPPGSVVTLPAGAWVNIRVNQDLSSDRNQAGDTFTATLTQPLIANGMVVARRGQTVLGRVSESSRGGRVKGTSRLGLEIIELSLVDGQQIPVRTQLVESIAGTTKGRDATAVAATTGVGAAIGAAAAGGAGAGLGALAGAGASLIGVLATKGRPTEIYPEDQLNFRTLAPIAISTEQAAHAFLPVKQDDYSSSQLQTRASRVASAAPLPPYWYGGPPFWGPRWGPGWGRGYGFYGSPTFIFGGGGFRRRR